MNPNSDLSCPRCGGENTYHYGGRYGSNECIRCKDCGYYNTVGTWNNIDDSGWDILFLRRIRELEKHEP